jgi:Tfp pilus assembly protein PilW
MKRIAKWLGNYRGMTLVETIIAFALSLMVVGVTATLLLNASNVFDESGNLNEADQLGDAAYGFIEDCLDDALGVEITAAGEDAILDFSRSIKLKNGRLFYNKGDGSGDIAIFDDTVYAGGTLTYTAAISENDLFTLTVILEKPDGTIAYRKTSSFRLMNVSLSAGLGAYDYGAFSADPDIYFEQN